MKGSWCKDSNFFTVLREIWIEILIEIVLDISLEFIIEIVIEISIGIKIESQRKLLEAPNVGKLLNFAESSFHMLF